MKNLHKIFDETFLTEKAFIRKNKKLKIVNKRVVEATTPKQAPLFPIDRIRP